MKKRISILLIFAMLLSTASFSVFAVEGEPNELIMMTISNVTGTLTKVDNSKGGSVTVAWDEENIPEGASVTAQVYLEGREDAYKQATVKAGTKTADFFVALGYNYSFKVFYKFTNEEGTEEEVFDFPETQLNVPAKPASVKTKVAPSPGAVKVTWGKSADATGYYVYRGGTKVATIKDNTKTSYSITHKPGNYVNYVYRVVPYKVTKWGTLNAAYRKDHVATAAAVRKVRPMYYKLTIKSKVTLKSHKGPSRSLTLYAGNVVYADRFTSGRYVFDKNGSTFYMARERAKSRVADYTKSFNYSKADAEYFINTKYKDGKGSPTGKLFWVSTYTQHVYYFVRSNKRWVLKNHWECATGKASTPTPTGLYGNKAVWQHVRSHHGLSWWTSFSSWNSFHGKAGSWTLGSPASSGCVRNSNTNAKFIYQHSPIKTQVLIY